MGASEATWFHLLTMIIWEIKKFIQARLAVFLARKRLSVTEEYVNHVHFNIHKFKSMESTVAIMIEEKLIN